MINALAGANGLDWDTFGYAVGTLLGVVGLAGNSDDFVGAARFGGCFFLPTGPVWLDLLDKGGHPTGGIRVEETVDLNRQTCQPYYIDILGPDDLMEFQTCTWYANITTPLESTPPYTYEWKWNGQVIGTGSSYTRNTGSESWNLLELTAWDALGSPSTTGKEVVVENLMGYPC